MSTLFYLPRTQLECIKLYFPLSHSVPRVDDLWIRAEGSTQWTSKIVLTDFSLKYRE
jgi:hypothetical protein